MCWRSVIRMAFWRHFFKCFRIKYLIIYIFTSFIGCYFLLHDSLSQSGFTIKARQADSLKFVTRELFSNFVQNKNQQIREEIHVSDKTVEKSLIIPNGTIKEGKNVFTATFGSEEKRAVNIHARLIDRPGDEGRAVEVNRDSLSPEDKKRWDDGFKNYHLNEFISDMIPLDRTLQDTRPPKCINMTYPEDLPQVSVVLPVNNEAWSVLQRTIYSFIKHTPRQLLREIIIVDDKSTADHYGKPLEDLASKLGIVRIIRTKKRETLIGARRIGLEAANGPIIFTTDSHMELQPDWFQPMADFLKRNPKTVVHPILDIIDSKTFKLTPEYSAANMVGLIDFNLRYIIGYADESKWDSSYSPVDPIRYYGVIGTYGIQKSFLQEVGNSDPGLTIWGGEDVEVAFKAMLCGDGIFTLPCAHMGHLWRHPTNRPQTVEQSVRNKLRLAMTWLGEYKKYYLERLPPKLRNMDYGNITEQQKIAAKCRPFRTLADVIPRDLLLISTNRTVTEHGMVINLQSKRCLTVMVHNWPSKAAAKKCAYSTVQMGQVLFLTNDGELRVEDGCLCLMKEKFAEVCDCRNTDYKRWKIRKVDQGFQIIHIATTKCLIDTGTQDGVLSVRTCDDSRKEQMWVFKSPDQVVMD